MSETIKPLRKSYPLVVMEPGPTWMQPLSVDSVPHPVWFYEFQGEYYYFKEKLGNTNIYVK
jgi:hypothetical protein